MIHTQSTMINSILKVFWLEILVQGQINAMLQVLPKIHIFITSSYTIEHTSLRKLGMILDRPAS